MKRFLITATALPLIAACAKSPDAIVPAAMPTGMYSHLSCAAAKAERRVKFYLCHADRGEVLV